MFNENIRVSLTDQLVENLSGWLRSVYINASELPSVEKKILVKFIIKEYLWSIKSDWKTNANVMEMLHRLRSTFDASRDLNDLKPTKSNKNLYFGSGPTLKNGASRNGEYGKFHRNDDEPVDLLLRVQHIFCGNTTNEKPAVSNNKEIFDQDKLASIIHIAERLEKRFQSTGLPLLTILEKLEEVLVAKDLSFSVATRISFDRIIDSLDPSTCGQVLSSEYSKVGSDDKAKLYDVLKAKHMQLNMYHKQGRLVKDCKVMYKEQLKKYGL